MGLTRCCSIWMSMLRLMPARLASSSSVRPRSPRSRRRLRASASAVSSGLATRSPPSLTFDPAAGLFFRPPRSLAFHPTQCRILHFPWRREMVIAGELTQPSKPISRHLARLSHDDAVVDLGHVSLRALAMSCSRSWEWRWAVGLPAATPLARPRVASMADSTCTRSSCSAPPRRPLGSKRENVYALGDDGAVLVL